MLLSEQKELVVKDEVFDPAFGIKIRNAKVSPTTLNVFCEGMRKIKLCEMSRNAAPIGEWVTMGVVTEKSDTKKSSNGNEYIVWKISDLTGAINDEGERADNEAPQPEVVGNSLQEREKLLFGGSPVKVLLFGECVRQFWKLQSGMTIFLNNPQWAESSDGKNEVLLKLFKAGQVIELGFCSDFGYCQGLSVSGQSCKNAVNTSLSSFCPFHLQQRARQLSHTRGALNRSYNLPPKKMRSLDEHFVRNASTPSPIGLKTVNRRQINDDKIYTKPVSSIVQRRIDSKFVEMKGRQFQELRKLVSEKPLSFGAKNLLLKQQTDKEGESPRSMAQTPSPSGSQKSVQSMREFIRSQPHKLSYTASPLLSPNQTKNITREEMKEQAKIKRAAELLRNGPAKKAKMQPNDDGKSDEKENSAASFGGKFTDDQIQALLLKKSTHDREANQADLDRQNTYFKNREIEEQVEMHSTTLLELKNCRVVTCSSCSYTSQHQSAHCKSLGHEVRRHFADKRFFKCKKCQKRTFCYDRMPNKSCSGCGSKEFYRVAMRDERKVRTEREQLKIREEESNFSSVKG